MKSALHRGRKARSIGSLLLTGIIGAGSMTAAFAQTELRLLNAFDNRYPGTPLVVQKYVEAVKANSAGRVTIKVNGPEVVNAFEQFEPVARGAFDLLFTVQPYHIGTTSVSMGVYALTPDPETWRKNGVFEFLDKEYQRHGLKLLSVISATLPGVGAYQALLKEPVAPGGELKGRKLRGNRLYQPMIESLGATVVTLQGGEVYPSLQKGVIDGVYWPILGAVDFKWYEQSKFMLRPRFGYSYHFLLMNLDRFNKLATADRQVIEDEGRRQEVVGMKVLNERNEAELEDLKKFGMRETSLDAVHADAAYKVFVDGIWSTVLSSRATSEQAKAFHDLVKAKGLIN